MHAPVAAARNVAKRFGGAVVMATHDATLILSKHSEEYRAPEEPARAVTPRPDCTLFSPGILLGLSGGRRGRRLASMCGLAVVVLAAAGCDTLLGAPTASPVRFSLASPSRLVGIWSGTWRSTRGASGRLTVLITEAATDRVMGTVQFSAATCPQMAPFEGTLVERTLTLTAYLGAPCGNVVLTIIESRAEEPRLVGSYRTDYPESGLLAIYPR